MNTKPQLTEVTHTIDEPEPTGRTGRFRKFAEGLRKRKVCRTAISYALVLWLNLQIGDVIFPMLGLPDWTLTLVITIGLMGFPVVLIIAWAFQITPAGIVLDDAGKPRDDADDERQLDTVVNLLLLVLSLALVVLLVMQFTFDDRRNQTAQAIPAPGPVIVSSLSFTSATDGLDSRVLASAVQEELRHQLIALDGVEVLPASGQLSDDTRGRRLSLSGSLLLDGKKAHVLAHLIDLNAGRYLMSVTFDLEVESVIVAEIAAARLIVEALRRVLPGKRIETVAGAEAKRTTG